MSENDYTKEQLLKLINKTMRHDVLNDLTIVNNCIEVYKENKDEKMLNNVLNIVRRSIELIKNMKELEALINAGENLRLYDLGEVIEDSRDKHQIEINVEGSCKALIDEAFSSVVDNLIRNAVIHGNASKIDVNINDQGECCLIEITDNGSGIPEDIKDLIFEEGFTGDNQGTGLGLYIARKTIERYGGSIQVEVNENQGSTFLIELKTE